MSILIFKYVLIASIQILKYINECKKNAPAQLSTDTSLDFHMELKIKSFSLEVKFSKKDHLS